MGRFRNASGVVVSVSDDKDQRFQGSAWESVGKPAPTPPVKKAAAKRTGRRRTTTTT